MSVDVSAAVAGLLWLNLLGLLVWIVAELVTTRRRTPRTPREAPAATTLDDLIREVERHDVVAGHPGDGLPRAAGSCRRGRRRASGGPAASGENPLRGVLARMARALTVPVTRGASR